MDFETVFNCTWGSERYAKGPFWRSWSTLGRPFGAFGVALGVHFGVQWVPLDAFHAQSLPKTPGVFHAPPLWTLFEPRGSPKGFQNEAKIDQKSIPKLIEFLAGFLIGFGMVFH